MDPSEEPPRPAPRLRQPDRSQVEARPRKIEQLIEADHPARVVWAFVEGLDLSPLTERIRSVEGQPGAAAIDPAILIALWLYAVLDKVSSARRLAKLCCEHSAYIWLCGGVRVNHHTLSDFWTDHEAYLEHQLTVQVAALMAEGLVEVERTAQDGMRVRASAGASSFRRGPSLEVCLEEAEARVAELRQARERNPGESDRRRQAAQERAARERCERVTKALEQLPEVEAKKQAQDRHKARVSTTDPDARVMKMADGGFRPAYNAQLCTDTYTQVIVGVEVTNAGSDQGQLVPMLEQVKARCGHYPDEALVDGGFVNKDDLDTLSELGVSVYAPVQAPKDKTREPYTPLPGDSEAVGAWRQRMGTESAKTIYKARAATAECVNALARNRGLQQFTVRGLDKVKTVMLWFALAHNVMRAAALRAAAAQG